MIAGGNVGPAGHVIGIDMTDEMLEKARKNADMLGSNHVEFRKGLAESLPVEDASVDLVISNGVLNLVPGTRTSPTGRYSESCGPAVVYILQTLSSKSLLRRRPKQI